MNGPRPSTRAFLCDLVCLPADSKIRFLGCVTKYDVSAGYVTLEHNYPRSRVEPSVVAVDINVVLQNLRWEELRAGSWLNVLGYIRESTPPPSFSWSQTSSQQSTEMPARVPPRPVYVEAIMVWPAGAIALGEYERILRIAQDIESRMAFEA